MILAAGAALSIQPEHSAPLAATGLGVLSIWLTCQITRTLIPWSPLLWLGVPLAAAMSSGLALFAAVGMDTIIFTFAILAATAAAIEASRSGRIWGLATALVFLSLARAEGPIYVVSLLFMLAVLSFKAQTNLRRSATLQLVAVCGAALLAQEIVRFAYYGDFIPNTVSAKGYATHGLSVLVSSGFRSWHDLIDATGHGFQYQRAFITIVAVPVAILAMRSLSRRSEMAELWLVATPVLVNIGITIWAGGDWVSLQRLNAPVWPLVLVLLASGLAWLGSVVILEREGPAAPAFATAVVLLATLLVGSFAVERKPVVPHPNNLLAPDESGWSLYGHQLGDLLRERGEPVVLLSDVVGKLPYYAGPTVYVRDGYGLTDEHNGEAGELWARTKGRSDEAYTFGETFDLLVTNDPDFLNRLLDYWRTDTSAAVGDGYVFFLEEDWLGENFFTLAREDDALTEKLISFCACAVAYLTRDLVEEMDPPR
jgi:hypothetical protein